MFSGKTEELLRRIKRAQIARQKVQVFKPAIDDRYSQNHLQSHDANRLPSQAVDQAWEIVEQVEDNTRIVGIDEAQFFDDSIVEVTQKLANRGIRVIVAGLDLDFRGQPFGPMPLLLAVAEEVTKLSAVCMVCGGPASRTQRISGPTGPDAERIMVGAKELYEARCRFCHDPEESSTRSSPGSGPLPDDVPDGMNGDPGKLKSKSSKKKAKQLYSNFKGRQRRVRRSPSMNPAR